MKINSYLIESSALFFCIILIFCFPHCSAVAAEEYSFDFEEFEPKPFEWGGYAEVKLEHININTESTFYNLNFYQNPINTIDRSTGALQLEFSYKKGIAVFNGVFRGEAGKDDIGWSDRTDVYEANLSLKPSPFGTFDIGKKVFKWGKGYAWNPVGFIDRSKDPNNPEEALEGYYGVGVDLIKSYKGLLRTIALTTVVLPVWKNVNEDFGEVNNVNLAAKLYMLYLNTDIDFIFYSGNSRSTRYGLDFSKNLAENFEIHGEFAYLTNLKKKYLTETGILTQKEYSTNRYLIGLRYLTESDITTIIEYYHNGSGFSESELRSFYQLIADANTQFLNTGANTLYQEAKNISNIGYRSPQAGRNYLYLKMNMKDPFDILYFMPGLIAIVNIDDQSYSINPEIQYTGFTNWEFRLRYTMLGGDDFTEFKEKQNENKFELRARYHF